MPSRWWVPVAVTEPESVTVNELHAVVTRWFDDTHADHRRQGKPFSISPLVPAEQMGWGFEIGVLTDEACERLQAGARSPGLRRFGQQSAKTGNPVLLHEHSWPMLRAAEPRRRWCLRFATPVSFRTGPRGRFSTPMPDVDKVLHSLGSSWEFAEGTDQPFLALSDRHNIWISRLEATTAYVDLRATQLAGIIGEIDLECGDSAIAQPLAALLALAPYAGVGAGRYKGMGVTRLQAVPSVGRSGLDQQRRTA